MFTRPLAGVIFAMEVIVAECTVAGVHPGDAGLGGSLGGQSDTVGDGALLGIPVVELKSLWKSPTSSCWAWSVASGCGIYPDIALHRAVLPLACGYPLYHRRLLYRCHRPGGAGNTGAGLRLVGTDSRQPARHRHPAAAGLCKILATAVSCGAGLPIGLIGPSLLIGACLGGALSVSPTSSSLNWPRTSRYI